MPVTIIEQQRRLREIARIRAGNQVEIDGKTRPNKLSKFRITSRDHRFVAAAAERYGGEPREWTNPYDQSRQYEVYVTADELPVVVPPTEMAFSQAFELWTAGGCQRRCDGDRELLSDRPCICDPEKRDCALTTRLSVILHELPGLGVSRLESHGYYAAVELAGAVEIVQQAFARGQLLPARLFLDPRTVKRTGPNGRPVTYKFVVPVLDFQLSFAALSQLGAPSAPEVHELGGGRLAIAATEPPFGTVPERAEPVDARPIADRLRAPVETSARGPHTPIKPTGKSPRRPRVSEAEGPDVSSHQPSHGEPPAPEPEASVDSVPGQGSLPLPNAVAMWCNDAGITTDDDRHRFLLAFSRIVGDGEYSSSKDVPAEHVAALRAALIRLKRGELTLDPDEPVIYGPDGQRVTTTGMPIPPAGATDGRWDAARWRKAIANVHGIGESRLLARLKRVSNELGVPIPDSLDGPFDDRVVIQVLGWLKEQQT